MFAHEMFKKRIKAIHIFVVLMVTILIASVIGSVSYSYVNQDRINKTPEKEKAIITGVQVTQKENCDDELVLYTTSRNSNVYLYCLEEFTVSMNDNTYLELKDYLETEGNGLDIIMVNFTQKLEWPANFNNPGNNLFSGPDFNILKCYTESGNKDIYIGDKTLDFFDNFCQ